MSKHRSSHEKEKSAMKNAKAHAMEEMHEMAHKDKKSKKHKKK